MSAELFTFGLAGRPYYEVLLECFSKLIEKSLRVQQESDSSGHTSESFVGPCRGGADWWAGRSGQGHLVAVVQVPIRRQAVFSA